MLFTTTTIHLSLRAFGFGAKFTRLIASIYKENTAAVIINNHVTLPFPVNQGVRQGDPISPLLYNIAIEPLLIKLRANLTGITIPRVTSIITIAFADDITVAVANQQDIDTLSKTLIDFQSASNSKINYHKSEAVPLSSTVRATLSPPCDFIHEEGTFTLLGMPFNTKKIFPGDEYFEELLTSLRKTVKTWRLRALSLNGKVLLINSKLLSKLWYTAILIPPPAKFLKQLDTIVRDFLWDKKTPANRPEYNAAAIRIWIRPHQPQTPNRRNFSLVVPTLCHNLVLQILPR
ncbi:uncharacterized protein VTP21DRAFT_7797 [Calcarisporiella thermophila]|uniref:uncharacterized protein n=1 Tax=Calcarisporiella thermophila TaxID=911321 RepID=UPI0037436416